MDLGGVIVWSLDMDDHLGTVCNEGPYPVIKKHLLKIKYRSENFYLKVSNQKAF